ncbi:RHS repeat domain-containing protein [Kitasatospora sp. NPDC092039]|uniref:RHS repeat domain-containing protein n=1 Tax=Kitasatospora sp. NPDC092039 TaxID=3364086 RepID=UPI00382720C8
MDWEVATMFAWGRRNPGKVTVNLGGGDELVYDIGSKSSTGTRYYTMPGGITLVRQGPTKLTYQFTDHHNTGTLSIDSASTTETRRWTDPFGAVRGSGAANSWAGDKGFVGGLKDDTTGFTNLGARQYQPSTGRFLSPDPLILPEDPQQWNAYAYSNNNPVDKTDPTGMALEECASGMASCSNMGTKVEGVGENYQKIVEQIKAEEPVRQKGYQKFLQHQDAQKLIKQARRNYGLEQLKKYNARTSYPFVWDKDGTHPKAKKGDDIAAPAEMDLCYSRIWECGQAFLFKMTADELKHKEYPAVPKNRDTDESNAFHHAVWQGMLAYHFGTDAAWQWADAHEAYHSKDEQEDHIADLVNNVKGRAIGEAARQKFGPPELVSWDIGPSPAMTYIVDMARAYLADGNYARRSDFEDWEKG